MSLPWALGTFVAFLLLAFIRLWRKFRPNAKGTTGKGQVKLAKLPSLFSLWPAILVSQLFKLRYDDFVQKFKKKKLQPLSVVIGPLKFDVKHFVKYYLSLCLTKEELVRGVDEFMVFTYFESLFSKVFLWIGSSPQFPLCLVGAVHCQSHTTVHRLVRSEAALLTTTEAALCRFVLKSSLISDWRKNEKGDVLISIENDVLFCSNDSKDLDSSDYKLVSKTINTYLIKAPAHVRKSVKTKDSSKKKQKPEEFESSDSESESPRFVKWAPVPSQQSRTFAVITGDLNPIHLWPATAWLFGFKANVMHGMWSVARIASAILSPRIVIGRILMGRLRPRGDQKPELCAAVSSELRCDEVVFETTFERPLFLPCDTLELTLSNPTDAGTVDTAKTVSFDLTADMNDSRKSVLKGTVEFLQI